MCTQDREENIHKRHKLTETGKQTRNGLEEPPMLLFFNLFFSNSEALIRPSNSDVSARL